MGRRFRIAVALAIFVAGLTGCGQKPSSAQNAWVAPPAPPVDFPELGPGRRIQPGIRFQEATLQRGAVPMKVWYYQPEKTASKLPLVLVPPAGSTLFVGMDLGDGDR